ncbi:glucokinase [Pseudoscourfieldia marina]
MSVGTAAAASTTSGGLHGPIKKGSPSGLVAARRRSSALPSTQQNSLRAVGGLNAASIDGMLGEGSMPMNAVAIPPGTLMLSGDIGGTNSRLCLWASAADGNALVSDDGHLEEGDVPCELVYEKKYRNDQYDSFNKVVMEFLEEAPVDNPVVVAACFAVAGPVSNNSVSFTNRSSWVVDGAAMAEDFGMARGSVRLINDFVANGYGLLTLQPHELHVINDVAPTPRAPMACVGAGTGLGCTYLTCPPDGGVYDAYPTEGGHTEFAPRTNLEIEMLKHLMAQFDTIHRISDERIVSGRGIHAVYGFMRKRFPEKVDAELDAAIEEAGDMAGGTIAQNIDNNVLCKWTMEVFWSTYGSAVGSAALKYLPYGGLYIAGGIAPKNIERMFDERDVAFWGDVTHTEKKSFRTGFLPAYNDKGRVRGVLDSIPLYVVLAEDVGQRGAKLMAYRLLGRVVSSGL